MGLPAKAADGAVVAIVIERARNPQTIVGLGRLVGQQGCVINIPHQARAKGGRGNAEDDVIGGLRLREAGLPQAAIPGIGAAGDGEQIFHSTVGSAGVGVAVGIKEEGKPGFARRTVGLDEGRNGVEVAVDLSVGNHLALWIDCRTGSAGSRL